VVAAGANGGEWDANYKNCRTGRDNVGKFERVTEKKIFGTVPEKSVRAEEK
jgi:hypothetical protein